MKKTRTIDVQINGGGGQCTTYQEVLTLGTHKLRVIVHTDTYANQNIVSITRWTGDEWNEVHRILPSAMKTNKKLGYAKPKPTALDYREDRDMLVQIASEILEVK